MQIVNSFFSFLESKLTPEQKNEEGRNARRRRDKKQKLFSDLIFNILLNQSWNCVFMNVAFFNCDTIFGK